MTAQPAATGGGGNVATVFLLRLNMMSNATFYYGNGLSFSATKGSQAVNIPGIPVGTIGVLVYSYSKTSISGVVVDGYVNVLDQKYDESSEEGYTVLHIYGDGVITIEPVGPI